MSNERRMKVHGKGCCKKEDQTPTILISGKYLNKYGFDIDSNLLVLCKPNELIITKL